MGDSLDTVPIVLSKYEMARIVGVRMTMVQQGLLHDVGDSIPLVRSEIIQGGAPFSMRRGDEFVHAASGEPIVAERPRTPRSRPPVLDVDSGNRQR